MNQQTMAVISSEQARAVGESCRRILVFASTFPSAVQPVHGVFVKERIRAVAALPEADVRVVSPVPYFPPIRWARRWYPLSQIAREEAVDGLPVVRPRYFLLPKVGALFHARSMAAASCPTVRRLQREFPFDLIDAHFVYPDGVAAARVARRLGKPLVITGRGEDMLRFPDIPGIGKQIRGALARADALIALSDEIADAMVANGANRHKITVIPNGIDCEKFRPLNRDQARRRLGLPADRRIVLSVGYRLECKGFHILVDALPAIRARHPDALVVIVGGEARWGQDFTPVIRERIRANGVEDCVRLVGPRPPEELPQWYSAADLFALLSSREGSPNALSEALACGLPAVATSVGGIPDMLGDRRLGVLLEDRCTETAAEGIMDAFSRTWDRSVIRREAQKRSWATTAGRVLHTFDALARPSPTECA